MLHSFNTTIKQLPGRARVAVLFALIVPLVALPVLIVDDVESMKAGEIWSLWLILIGVSAAVGYMLMLFGRLLLWVQDGFDVATRVKATQMLSRVSRIALILAAGIFFAAYTRYDVVALVDPSGDFYRYLVWDRWSGETYLEYGSMRRKHR
jgi:hypothetical protein